MRSNKDQAIRCMNKYKVNIRLVSIKNLQQRNKYLMIIRKLAQIDLKNMNIRMIYRLKQRDKKVR